jgi:hypothetical protein
MGASVDARMYRCSQWRHREGLITARTCQQCGLGPCQFRPDPPPAAAPVPAPAPVAAEPMVRFCPECGNVGEVEPGFRDCCPDGSAARVIPEPLARKCRETFLRVIRRDALLPDATRLDDPATAREVIAAQRTTIRGLLRQLREAREQVVAARAATPSDDELAAAYWLGRKDGRGAAGVSPADVQWLIAGIEALLAGRPLPEPPAPLPDSDGGETD